MKNFEYAQTKTTKKSFKMPSIKTTNYDIPLWALPIAPFVIACDKFNKWRYNRLQWSDEKATKVLDYFLPYVLEYVEEDDVYYFNNDWHYTGWDVAKRVPLPLKKWAKKFGHRTLNFFLLWHYEKEGFTKSVEENYEESWIKFEKKA